MEYPTEDEIEAMSNREFAALIRSQADLIDRMIAREVRPAVPPLTESAAWL